MCGPANNTQFFYINLDGPWDEFERNISKEVVIIICVLLLYLMNYLLSHILGPVLVQLYIK